MYTGVIRQIAAFKKMTVAELRCEWERLNGEPARSMNRDYLWRRLAWRVQEIANGGLSDAANARLEELAPDSLQRTRSPLLPVLKTARSTAGLRVRDPRLPSPGSVLTRQYHGQEIRVLTLDDGFEWNGERFGSLSAVARAITGQRWNGLLFFGLTQRKRKA